MKAKQLSDVRDIVNSGKFRTWFDGLVKARGAAREATLRHEELLTQVHLMEFRAEMTQKNAMDTLYRAAAYEDAAARMQVEAVDLENKSLELVGVFEKQRLLCSELWAATTAEAQTAEGAKPDRAADHRLKRLKDEYERETTRKTRMWEDVEAMWATCLEKNLAVVENRVKGARVRKESEVLFRDAEQASRIADGLKAESEASAREQEKAEDAVRVLLASARAEFEAIVHEDFLYWPQRENNKLVYVVPLFGDAQSYNIELKACAVYQAERNRGVEFLEPVVEPPKVPTVDTRLDDFFLKDRPTRKREQPAA